MYNNEKIFVPAIGEEVHISRIFASFLKAGEFIDDEEFKELIKLFHQGFNEWLKTLGISKSNRRRIRQYLECGKMELEHHLKTLMNDPDNFDSSYYTDD